MGGLSLKEIMYIGVLLGTVTMAACTAEEMDAVVDTPIIEGQKEAVSEEGKKFAIVPEAEAAPVELTQQQKEAYHKRYVDAVEWLNQQKVGLHMEVSPLEQFEDEAWRDPEIFEKDIRSAVDEHLAKEREMVQSLSEADRETTLKADGKIAKKAYMYTSEVIRVVEIAANFTTQYNETHDRQVFTGIDGITTKGLSPNGTWEQTSAEASLIDGGRTYSIDIEGIWSGMGLTFEKAFTIEFRCDQFGNIY